MLGKGHGDGIPLLYFIHRCIVNFTRRRSGAPDLPRLGLAHVDVWGWLIETRGGKRGVSQSGRSLGSQSIVLSRQNRRDSHRISALTWTQAAPGRLPRWPLSCPLSCQDRERPSRVYRDVAHAHTDCLALQDPFLLLGACRGGGRVKCTWHINNSVVYPYLSPPHCSCFCCRRRRRWGRRCSYCRSRLREECGSHVRKEIESLEGQTPDCGAFLQLVDHKWQDHCSSMLTLRNVFLYLDRSFVLQSPSLRSIWDMGLELFRNFFQVCVRLTHLPWYVLHAPLPAPLLPVLRQLPAPATING